ncbi:MAG: relaxase domain-containing protein, partial [Micromonosporaceae bacterium]|nr:relaxase domain-containing protein [Micromonosporaceae bacterium]
DGSLLYRHAEATDAVFKAALRAELTRLLGLSWTLRGEQWEIEGMPAGLCRRWSTRSIQLGDWMAEHGTSGGRAAQQAAYATRKAKADTAPTARTSTPASTPRPATPATCPSTS